MNRLETSPKPGGNPKENGHAKSSIAASADVAEAVDRMHEKFAELRTQLAGVIVGQ